MKIPMMRNASVALRLSLLLSLTIVGAVSSFDAKVNWNSVYQRITGWGAGTDDVVNPPPDKQPVMDLPEPARTQVLDLLFDTTKGIGLTMIRLDVPYILWPEGGTFDITGWAPHAALCQEAMKRGANYFFGAPWTPPFWMKTVHNLADGSLAPAHYQDFADYLSHCVRDMKSKYNVELKGMSMQNEPNFNPPYGGCLYTPAQLDAFAKVLGATWARDGVKAKIILADVNLTDGFVPMCDAVLNDTAACKYVGACGFHVYMGAWPMASQFTNAHAKGKEVWMTETSSDTWSGIGDVTMKQAGPEAKLIHDCMTVAKTNAWNYFELAGEGNPPIREVNGQYYTTKLLYCIGNYSKFIRPGWYMVDIPFYTPDSAVGLSAYRDSVSGRFAIVAQNFGGLKVPYDICYNFSGFKATSVTPWLTDAGTNNLAKQPDIACVNGASFSATIAPQSVVTFTGTAASFAASDVRIDSLIAISSVVKGNIIIPGEQAVLAWSSTNATALAIDNGVGSVSASGTKTVAPTTTTTYSLTAQGPNGPVTNRATIVVQTPRTPENPSPVTNGLNYSYYETQNESFDLSSMTPTKSGTVNTFDMSVKNRNTDISFKFDGYVNIPTDGVYTFYAWACDIVRLNIGTTTLLLNDNGITSMHGYSGSIALKAGRHAIALQTHNSFSCTPSVRVAWTGPGIPAITTIPAGSLYRTGQPAHVLPPNLASPSAIGIKIVYGTRGPGLEIWVPKSGTMVATMIDRQGRTVRTLTHEAVAPGRYVMDLGSCDGNGRALSAGSYLCSLRTSEGQRLQAPVVIMGR